MKHGKNTTGGMGHRSLRLFGKSICKSSHFHLSLLFSVLFGGMPSVQAKSDRLMTEGSYGTLYVHGALTESARRLEIGGVQRDIKMDSDGLFQRRTCGI